MNGWFPVCCLDSVVFTTLVPSIYSYSVLHLSATLAPLLPILLGSVILSSILLGRIVILSSRSTPLVPVLTVNSSPGEITYLVLLVALCLVYCTYKHENDRCVT